MRLLSLAVLFAIIGGGCLSTVTSWFYWRNRQVRGLMALAVTALIAGVAAIAYGIALVVSDPESSRWLYGLYLYGRFGSAIGWFVFALSWTERVPNVRSRWFAVFVVPYGLLITAGIYETLVVGVDGAEALFMTIEATTAVGLTVPAVSAGPFWLVVRGLSSLLFFGTISLLIVFVVQPEQRLYRKQNQLLVLAAVVVPIAELVLRMRSVPIEGMPLLLLPTTLVGAIAIFRYGVFDVSPIARAGLVDELDAGILAYDNAGRIIDSNPLARSLLDVSGPLLGSDLETVLSDSPLTTDIDDIDGSPHHRLDGAEFTVDLDGRTRYFAVQTSTIEADDGQLVARSLLFSDITTRRRHERERDVLKQVFSRVLRHNLRNDMNLIRGAAEEIADQVDDQEAVLAEQILTTSSKLVDVSEKARLVEKVVERSTGRKRVDLVAAVEVAIDRIEDRFPQAAFETDLPADLTVVGHPALDVAIENAIENAVEHGSTSPPSHAQENAVEHGSTSPDSRAVDGSDTVSVVASVEDGECTLEIIDDGPGIPEAELAPLDERAETPLQHASGVGLWLIQWVTTRSGGTVSFDTSAGGTTVRMALEIDGGTTPTTSDATAVSSPVTTRRS